MQKKYFVIVVFIYGFYFNFFSISAADDVLKEQDTRLKIVEKVLESSLVGLKKSALEVSQRNRFLLNENKNLEGEIQELEERLKSIQVGTPLSASEAGPSETEAYQKLQINSLQEQITQLSKEENLLEEGNRKLGEENKAGQEQLEKTREDNSARLEEIISLHQEFHSLKTQKEPSGGGELTQEKKRLLSSIQAKKKRIEDLRAKKRKLQGGKGPSSSRDIDKLRQKQGQLKEEVLKLERGSSLISEDERQYLNQLQKIEQSRDVQLTQFNQEISFLTSHKEELKRTLATAQEKLKTSPLYLPSDQPLESLEEKLNSLQQENQALKAQTTGN